MAEPDFVDLDDFEGQDGRGPQFADTDPDRIHVEGDAEGAGGEVGADTSIVYSPDMLLRFATFLEETMLPICQFGAERTVGIGTVQTGYFQHGFELRQFCVDIENTHIHNFESFERGLKVLIGGFRIVARRYTTANEETEDMVLDLQQYIEQAGVHFAEAGFVTDHEPETGGEGAWKGDGS